MKNENKKPTFETVMEENNNGVCLERGCQREIERSERMMNESKFVKSERNEERELNEKKKELREEKHRKSHVRYKCQATLSLLSKYQIIFIKITFLLLFKPNIFTHNWID